MAEIGDKGVFGGECVDIIHTKDFGNIEIYAQDDFAYFPPPYVGFRPKDLREIDEQHT